MFLVLKDVAGKRTRSFADTQDDEVLNDQWCKDMQKGVSHILEETWVKASEAHYDAKLWPHVHPYGTGSVYSEPGAGGLHHHARNRLTNIQSWFRRSSSWGQLIGKILHQFQVVPYPVPCV